LTGIDAEVGLALTDATVVGAFAVALSATDVLLPCGELTVPLCVPMVGPSVHVARAVPSEAVVALVGLKLPEPVPAANLTATPASGDPDLLSARTTT
jgi:hypothetical protein